MWGLREWEREKPTYPFINIWGPYSVTGLVQGPGYNAASRVNKASALRSLAFYGGDKIAMHCDMKKNRSGGGAGGITSLH